MIHDNVKSIVFMVLSMALFAVEDLFIKLLSQEMPASEIMVLLGLGGAGVFAVWAHLAHEPIFEKALLNKQIIIRTLADLFGALFYISAIVLTPLSSASTILQATPLAVTAGAALFLGEKVGFRRWSAVIIGFMGILLIVKPGSDAFSTYSLLAVAAVFCLSARDLATRAMNATFSTLTVSIYAFLALAMAGVCATPFFGGYTIPSAFGIGLLLASLVSGVVAYYLIVLATRTGDMSVIAPFRYSRIIFAMVLSILILGERPDILTWIGASIIVLSGSYMFLRERQIHS